MAPMTASRRRGPALEGAILEAGWQQLVEAGYAGFTFEAVASRARTSKAVLYRRWHDKEALLLAVLGHQGFGVPVETPDIGSLREDVLIALRAMNERMGGITAALFSTVLSAYFAETHTSFAHLRGELVGDRRSMMIDILQRAMERGEVTAPLPPRVVTLPVDLVRHELLMNLRPVPDEVIVDIVDTVFLPLATDPRRSDPRRTGPSEDGESGTGAAEEHDRASG